MRRSGGKLKSRGVTLLAWLSFIFAVAGGAAATPTWIGTVIDWTVTIPPAWFAVLLLITCFVATCIDLIGDGVPNWVAIAAVVVMPSVAKSVDGKLGDTVTKWSDAVLESLNGMLGDWLPADTPAFAVAAAFILASALMARRVVKKMPGGSVA